MIPKLPQNSTLENYFVITTLYIFDLLILAESAHCTQEILMLFSRSNAVPYTNSRAIISSCYTDLKFVNAVLCLL